MERPRENNESLNNEEDERTRLDRFNQHASNNERADVNPTQTSYTTQTYTNDGNDTIKNNYSGQTDPHCADDTKDIVSKTKNTKIFRETMDKCGHDSDSGCHGHDHDFYRCQHILDKRDTNVEDLAGVFHVVKLVLFFLTF